jgi:integrase
MFAGLRRGELMALRWEDVDLAAGVVHVERSCDIEKGEFLTPKSKAGVRTVPIVGALAPYRDHLMRCGAP